LKEEKLRDILLIGGAGYIGSVVAKYFLDCGDRVIVIDNLIYNNTDGVAPLFGQKNYTFVNADIRNQDVIKNLVHEGSHVVILAGLVGDPITKKYAEISKEINFHGIKYVLEQCDSANVEQVIFVSTCSNYGLMAEDQLADEKSELNPLSRYAEDKVAIENHLIKRANYFSFVPTILRFSTAFGWSPRMRLDLTVNEFVYEACYGKSFEVYDPDTWRPYCHVEDFARAIDYVFSTDTTKVNGEVFNVGCDENNFTKRGLVELIGSKISQMNFTFREKGSDPRNYKVDFSKIRTTIGFKPIYTVEAGVNQILEAYEIGLLGAVENNRFHYGNYKIET